MSYDDQVVRIERIANGWCAECYEPSKKKKDSKNSINTPYVDPWKEYAFTTIAEVTKFLTTKLPELDRNAKAEYDDAFEEAAAYMGKD